MSRARAVLPNLAVLDQGVLAAQRRWPGVSGGLGLGEARPPHAGPHDGGDPDHEGLIRQTSREGRGAFFLGSDCPASGDHVNGGRPGRCTRSGYADH